MALRYTITQYSFRKPKAISALEYLERKQKLQNDSSFSLFDPNDTIKDNYRKLFKFLTGAGISALLLPIF